MRETKGEAVSSTEVLNNLFTCLQNAAERRLLKAAGGNLFWSSVQNHHEKQRTAEGVNS